MNECITTIAQSNSVCLLQVMLNSKELETVDSSKLDNVICLPTEPGKNVLDIMVENLGRVNYASFKSSILNEQHKGNQL